MDIFQREARGLFSPPNGNDPQTIPDYWRPSPEEEPRTDLPELSDAELNAIGWKGPIVVPPHDSYTHYRVWNSETREYDVLELSQSQKEERVDYQKFWNDLIDTSAYATIKATATQSLAANTLATEFIALLSDAKNGHANVNKIQLGLFEVLENISFTQEELLEIEETFVQSGMYSIYTLQPPTA